MTLLMIFLIIHCNQMRAYIYFFWKNKLINQCHNTILLDINVFLVTV